MTSLYLVFFLLSSITMRVLAQGQSRRCSGVENGKIVQFNCHGYYECQYGSEKWVACPVNEVFERKSMSCVGRRRARTACGLPADCYGKNDSLYADYQFGCETFYACSGQNMKGRLYCPGDLVFSNALQRCEFRENVAPPCGIAK